MTARTLISITPASRAPRAAWLLLAVMMGVLFSLALSPSVEARQSLEIDGEVPPAIARSLNEIVAASRNGEDADTASPQVSRRLVALMRSEGYYGAAVRTTVRQNRPLYIVVPARRFTVEEVVATTAPDVRDAAVVAAGAMTLSADAPLRASSVLATEAAGLAALQEQGWPDAEVLDRDVVVDHETASGRVTLNYETGQRSTYGLVRLQSEGWRPAFVERLADLPEGDNAQLSALRGFQAQLADLDSVARAQVQLAPAEAGRTERDVLVTLTPAPRRVVEGGFAISTSEGAGVDGRWTRRNRFGGDETLSFSAQLSTLEQSMTTELSAPHWRQRNQTLTLLATGRNEETDAFDQQELELEADITRRFNPRWTAGLALGLDGSRIRAASQIETVNTVTVFSGLTAVFDSRDDRTDAHRGIRASATVTPALTVGDIESGYVITDTALQNYQRLGNGLVLAARVRAGSIAGASLNSVPADQRFYAGGGGSVRGYDFQSLSPPADDGSLVGGRSIVEASAELRWRSEGRWGAVVFADVGAASTQTAPEFSDLRTGVGIGARYHFDFAPLRLDIAAPVDRQADEASLHVYVGLGQAF